MAEVPAGIDDRMNGRCTLDTVEKVVARRPNTTSEIFDLSDRPTNRSGASVKGKATHENRVRTTVTDFFNSIGRHVSIGTVGMTPSHLLVTHLR